MTRRLLLLSLVSLTAGCSTQDVFLDGSSTGARDEESLRFDESGFALVRDGLSEAPLFLPRAQEAEHWGLVVVDTTPLPPAWRPEHAPDGGLVVSLIDKASPLAAAGLRGFDRIVSLNGEPVAGASAFLNALSECEEARLEIVLPSNVVPTGTTATVVAKRSVESIQARGGFSLPYLFSSTGSTTGASWRLLPFFGTGLLAEQRSVRLLAHAGSMARRLREGEDDRVEALSPAHARGSWWSVERFSWSALFRLVQWESELDLETGAERSEFTLFWLFSFGDDLAPATS